jgi:3-isopropylmalate/(R)-2-methylmalate dehydratase small subunit
MLPIRVSKADLDRLMDDAERGANATISVDLAKQEIRGPDGGVIRFEVDPFKKHCLLNGLDEIGLTLEKRAKIDAFERNAAAARPWV